MHEVIRFAGLTDDETDRLAEVTSAAGALTPTELEQLRVALVNARDELDHWLGKLPPDDTFRAEASR